MNRRRHQGRNLALVLGFSGPAIGLLYGLGVPLGFLVALHGLSALAAWRLWRRPGPGGRELGLQVFSILMCFPVVGSPFVWLIYGREGKRETDLFDAYRKYIAYEYKEPRYLKPVGNARARLRREVSVLPLRDQLGLADISAKQSAAGALAKVPGDTGVKVLRQALSHEADDTRLLASLALLRKEELLVSQLNAARAHCKKASESPEAWLARARVARDYSESGLPAPKAAEAYWQECEAAAEQALDLKASGASELEAWLHLAAGRAGRGAHEDARGAALAALRCDPDCIEAALAHCEALFALGEFDSLPKATAALARTAPGSELHALGGYWSPVHGS